MKSEENKLVLLEVKPPYDTDAEDCDEHNPNVDNEELWNEWLKSVDYIKTDYSKDLLSTEDYGAKFGHRGVRIGKNGQSDYTWYYNIVMGYKVQ